MSEKASYAPAGKEWFGFFCSNSQCGLPLLLGEIRPGMLDANGVVKLRSQSRPQKVTCPHCGNESAYPIQQLKRFRTVEKQQLS
jgi:RNase P subunit RPR2